MLRCGSVWVTCAGNAVASPAQTSSLPFASCVTMHQSQAADLKRKREEEATERAARLAVEKEERDAKRQKLEEERKKEAVCLGFVGGW